MSGLKYNSILVFCSTKASTKELARALKQKNFSVEDIHSDLEQKQREIVLNDFKAKNLNILVATDIMSRGIDIEDIDLVINYDVPHDGEDYIHRIGRTARAAADGVAFTFVNEREQDKFHRIEELVGTTIPKESLPDFLGDAPEYAPKKRSNRQRNKKRYYGNKKKRFNKNKGKSTNKR